MKRLTRIACIATMLAVGSAAHAGLINTLVSNFDIAFDGMTGEITDFNRPDGGNLDPNEARTVSGVEFEVDGVSQVILMNPPDALWGDLKITNLGSELTTGALVMNAGGTGSPEFGLDVFSPAMGGIELQIGIDDISYTVVTTGVPGLNFFNFFAEGFVTSQQLPLAQGYAGPVLVSYTATDVMVFQGQNGVRSLVASGQLTITGEMIPEPTAAALAALGAVGGMVRRRG